jgi:hypothetical protein
MSHKTSFTRSGAHAQTHVVVPRIFASLEAAQEPAKRDWDETDTFEICQLERPYRELEPSKVGLSLAEGKEGVAKNAL